MSLSHRRVRSALFLALATLLAVTVGWQQHDAAAGIQKATAAKQQPENPTLKHSLSGKAPQGNWSVAAIPDLAQATDTTTPVVVSGLSSLFGKKEWGGFLKVIAVKLTNRTPAAVARIRLGWLIVTERDRVALKSDADAKKAEGSTPLFETDIAAHGMAKLDSTVIDFLAEAKPLIKKGRLNGNYVIKVRVIEVEFVDGSIWHEQESQSKAGEDYRSLSQSYDPLYEPMTACDNTKCISSNNNGILDQCAPDPFPGLFCRPNLGSCTPDGTQCVCNNNVCANCPDADEDDVTTCEGDCDDNNYNISPLAPENCSNGIDDNCNGLIDRFDTFWCRGTPTPTPGGIGCTTPGINGGCLPGTSPNEYGMCCTALAGESGELCPDPPASFQCGTVLPETACPYIIYGFGSCYSPVLIDVAGDGLRLTDAGRGVRFDLDGNPDGVREQVSWTAPLSDDAWLALDRNRNGRIDSGRELFGNLTLQPASATGNGFIALAQYDTAKNGGNADGVIDARDGFFPLLRLWQDVNHNGVSEAAELHALPALGVTGIDLKYKESKRTDEFGNEFRYRAQLRDAKGEKVGRSAWDVFLVRAP